MKHLIHSFLILGVLGLAAPLHAQEIGCDEAVFEQAENLSKALQQQSIEAAKNAITQPTPVEQTGCLDQYSEIVKTAMKDHSDPEGKSTSIAQLVQQPLEQTLSQFSSNIAGSIQSIVNTSFSDVVSNFTTSLAGGTPTTNCDMQEEAWLISQCIEMPEMPSLSNIIGQRIDALSGAITNIPDRLIEKACSGMNNKLGQYFGDVNSAINAVADDATKPLSDAASAINGAI